MVFLAAPPPTTTNTRRIYSFVSTATSTCVSESGRDEGDPDTQSYASIGKPCFSSRHMAWQCHQWQHRKAKRTPAPLFAADKPGGGVPVASRFACAFLSLPSSGAVSQPSFGWIGTIGYRWSESSGCVSGIGERPNGALEGKSTLISGPEPSLSGSCYT